MSALFARNYIICFSGKMEILGTGGGGVRHDILGGGRVDNIASGPCNRNTEERKYVQVSQSTIITYAGLLFF